MRAHLLWLAVSLVLFLPMTVKGEDGKLAEVRDEVREKTPSKEYPSSHECDDDVDSLLEYCIFRGVLAIYGLPHDWLRDRFDNTGLFATHPYADGVPGYMRIRTPEMDEQPELLHSPTFANAKPWSISVSLEEGNDFDGLNRLGAHILIDTGLRLGLSANSNFYTERLSSGATDHLTVGDVNLLFRFAQDACVQFRSGIGTRFLADDRRTDFGVNLVYGADCFLKEPFVVSWQIDGGTLGRAGVFHFHGTAGCCFAHGEAFLGYDYLLIGSQSLQGPLVGLRLWF